MEKRDPAKQFSKWLAKWTAIFWFVFTTWLSVLLMLVPEAALYTVYMAIIVTVVMMVNVVSYTSNSIQEKLMLAMIERTRLQFTLGPGKAAAGLEAGGNEPGTEEGTEADEPDAEDAETEGEEDG